MRILTIMVLSCGVLATQGCGLSRFVNPMEQPIIEDRLGKSGFRTLSTTSSRRVVIFDQNSHKICAEPPPDVADNLTSAFATALKGADGTVEAKAEISKAFANTAKQLFQSSQGIRLYRDGMYNYCQLYLNGAIDSKTLLEKQDSLLEKTSGLIDKEIPFLPYIKADNVTTPALPPPTPKLGGEVNEAEPAKPTVFNNQ